MTTGSLSSPIDRLDFGYFLNFISSLIADRDKYVLPEKMPVFEKRVGKLQKDFFAQWSQEFSNSLDSAQKQDFEHNAKPALTRLVSMLIKEIYKNSNGNWKNIEPVCRDLWCNHDRLIRRHELHWPQNKETFVQTLWWMAEQGMEEELDMVRKIQMAPPFISDEISQLLNQVEALIHKRVSDPYYVIKRGDVAYLKHKSEWDQKYAGKFIAIYRDRVIDADLDEAALVSRLIQIQRERGRFRAYIIKVGKAIVALEDH